jgi:LCP family protein required for cell wall assembly
MRSMNDVPALERLERFEREHEPSAPTGSGAGALFGSIVLPGIATIRRRPLLGIVLFTVGVAAPIVLAAWIVSRRDDLLALALEPRFMTAVSVVALTLVLTRMIAVFEVTHAFRRVSGIGWRATLAMLIVVLLAAPAVLLAARANQARASFASVFGDGGPSLFVPTDTGGIDPNTVTNILLLGGDAGPGRWGMRTDSMILVSVHEASGRTALVSIPRNLQDLQFPPGSPLGLRFPDGFDEYDGLTNAIFTYVTGDEAMMQHYGASGRQAQAVALSEGIGYSLDIEIDDYALVNMQGFTEIIDAVGGVTLDLAEAVPLPPSLPGERPLPASIGPGPVEMDGAMAIAYARSRSADSDYQRMGRQRQLLAALGSQVSTRDAVSGFDRVTGALDDSMRTSMSAGDFSGLLDRLGDNSNIGESIGLVPPLIEPGNPDWAQVRAILDAVEQYVRTGTPSGYA